MSPAGQDLGEDDSLLSAIADGNREAFRLLMNRHAPKVLALAQRITRNAQDADDVMQEAFLRVWVMAPKWRPDGGARFSTWLFRVAYNLCIDKRRARTLAPLEEAGDPPDPAPGILESAIGRQQYGLLLEAVAKLPERQKDALTLYYFAEQSGPEAARSLGISVPALEALLVRARRGLRDMLIRRGLKNFGEMS